MLCRMGRLRSMSIRKIPSYPGSQTCPSEGRQVKFFRNWSPVKKIVPAECFWNAEGRFLIFFLLTSGHQGFHSHGISTNGSHEHSANSSDVSNQALCPTRI